MATTKKATNYISAQRSAKKSSALAGVPRVKPAATKARNQIAVKNSHLTKKLTLDELKKYY